MIIPKTYSILIMAFLIPLLGNSQVTDSNNSGAIVLKHHKKDKVVVIEIGSTIRVDYSSYVCKGELIAVTADSISMTPLYHGGRSVNLPIEGIKKVAYFKHKKGIRATGVILKGISYPLIFIGGVASLSTTLESFDPIFLAVHGVFVGVIGLERLGDFMWRKRYRSPKWNVVADPN